MKKNCLYALATLGDLEGQCSSMLHKQNFLALKEGEVGQGLEVSTWKDSLEKFHLK